MSDKKNLPLRETTILQDVSAIRCEHCQRELRLGEGRYMIMQNDRLVQFCVACFHSQPFPFWVNR